jgi:hypothetical protein
MLDKIIEKIDFKWWTSLEAQQKLTVMMALMILALCFVCGFLFLDNGKIRTAKNIEISRYQAKAEACMESTILYLQEKDRQFYQLLIKQKEINSKQNENVDD